MQTPSRKIALLIAIFLVSCGAPASITPTLANNAKPTRTAAPTPTDIAGFEDWSVVNPQDVHIESQDGALTLTLTHHALWFMDQRGVLVYKPVSGDFMLTAIVHAAKHSDPSKAPGGDGSVQLGGLMIRNASGPTENYVFIVLGDDGDGLSIETKNTTDGFSKYEGPAWDATDAELRICRIGQTVLEYKRHVDTGESWMLAGSFDRPDLPADLQAGFNIYTDGAPDVQARFDQISIDPLTSRSECEEN